LQVDMLNLDNIFSEGESSYSNSLVPFQNVIDID